MPQWTPGPRGRFIWRSRSELDEVRRHALGEAPAPGLLELERRGVGQQARKLVLALRLGAAEVLAQRNGLQITDSFGLHNGRLIRFMPNLLASTAVLKFSR